MTKKKTEPTKSKHYADYQNFGRPIEWTPERIEEEFKAFQEWLQDSDNIFYHSFAHERGYSKDTLRRVAERHPDFLSAYNMAMERQPTRIVDGALKQNYNGNFAQFVLRCNHGWKEPKDEDPQTEMVEELKAMRRDMNRLYENNPEAFQSEAD